MLSYETFDEWLGVLQESEPNQRAINAELKNVIMSIPNYMDYEYNDMQETLVDGINDALANNSDIDIEWEFEEPFDVKRFVQGRAWSIDIIGYLKNVDLDLEIDKFLMNRDNFKFGDHATMYVPNNYSFGGKGEYDRFSFKQPHLHSAVYTVYADGSAERQPMSSTSFGPEEYKDSDRMAEQYRGLYTDMIEVIQFVGSKLRNGLVFKAKDSKTFLPFIRAYLADVGDIDY